MSRGASSAAAPAAAAGSPQPQGNASERLEEKRVSRPSRGKGRAHLTLGEEMQPLGQRGHPRRAPSPVPASPGTPSAGRGSLPQPPPMLAPNGRRSARAAGAPPNARAASPGVRSRGGRAAPEGAGHPAAAEAGEYPQALRYHKENGSLFFFFFFSPLEVHTLPSGRERPGAGCPRRLANAGPDCPRRGFPQPGRASARSLTGLKGPRHPKT